MAVMEFHRANFINTTTQFKLDANQTGTVQYIFDNNKKVMFSTSGYNSTTATTISVEFSSAKMVSHIFLMNHNLKDYIVYYNSATGNSLASSTTNSATSSYFAFSTTTVNSIQIQLNNTIAGSVEKQIGELIITERRYVFERNPSIEDFRYTTERKQVRHQMPDGGVVLFNIRDKYHTNLKLEYFSQTSHDTLSRIYDDALPIYFVPFPTTTGWDGKGFEVNWSGRFDFRYSTNVKSPGYTGTINLEETPSS